MKKNNKSSIKTNSRIMETWLNIIFIILSILVVFPVLMTISISFTDETSLFEYGYKIIPKQFSLDSYKYVFSSGAVIGRAYLVTIFVTVVGTIIATFITALYAYALSRPDFKYKKFFAFYSFFTMLFNGGLVATYIVISKILGLSNTIWALLLPPAVSAWNIMVLRSFFEGSVPFSIIESGQIDGASEYRIFFKLVLPISIPGIMTIALFFTLNYWNDWMTPMLYIRDTKLYTLSFLLQNMLTNIQEMLNRASEAGTSVNMTEIPQEGARMALCLVAVGPILVIYPFFQKYFVQGLTIGAVKG